ncbi:unnamed protein product [Durusdinium trenchii]|uniref:Mitochondrial (Protein EMBRYO DEFECTIVE 1586) (Protein INCREASED SIZE EXCLUSION LIMIT 1) n=2 Tax=Durusdinium trenchii TaxID=1381693 RepID=A0ABP0JQP9_9DINO
MEDVRPGSSASSSSRAPRAKGLRRLALLTLTGLAIPRQTFLAPRNVARLATPDPSVQLAYKEGRGDDFVEEDEDDLEEIDMDTMSSFASDKDDAPSRFKPDMDQKFKRTGFFDRKDLSRLDVSEFDKNGALRKLSIEQLEARLEKRYQASTRAKVLPKRSEEAVPKVPTESRQSDVDDFDLYWKPPMRKLRPAQPRPMPAQSGMQKWEPVELSPPMKPEEEAKSAKGRPGSLQSWLLTDQARPRNQAAKEEKQNSKVSNSKDRVGNSKFRKMYKAVMRNYSALPWDRVEGQTSWLDPANKTWQELGMCSEESREMLELMAELGVHTPNRLQGLALPEIISGKDVMLTSTTGSGKTLAFLLPLLERFILPLAKTGLSSQKSSLPHHLAPKILSKPRILVVAPGRELSQQTTRVILDLLNPFSPMLNVTNLVGKDNHKRQDEALRDRQPVIVVGTPGKLMDHAMEGRLILNELNAVVIDEVDALLSMSRKDHVQLLLQHLGINDQAQRILVSASGSMEGDALGFAEAILRDGWKLVGPRHRMELPKRVLHLVNGAPDVTKKLAFIQRLSTSDPEVNSMIVFCNNHERVRKVAEQLNERNILTDFLTGNRSKEARDKAISNFATNEVQALVATDAAMRGLDFRDVTHVVNFELPGDAATYAHRAGRCGRMGYNGIVISLASGGYMNKRLRSYSRALDFELIEANVNDGELGADLGMMYGPEKRKR